MSNTKVVTEVTGIATVTEKSGAVTETKHKVGLVVYDGPVAEVGCEMSHTMNLGNYQSAKLQVSLKGPSNIDSTSLDNTFEYIKEWCDTKLSAMIAEAQKTLG